MRFENGMLGVCISVLAIMGMILSGFVLSVDQYDRTVTGYEYVTDISGLFDYSDQPTFIDYNPSANWTGFYTSDPDITDGINFTGRSEPANSYPINQENTQLAEKSMDLSQQDLPAANPPGNLSGPYDTVKISDDTTSPNTGDLTAHIGWPRVATVASVLEKATGLGDYNVVRIDLNGDVIGAPSSSWNVYSIPVGNLGHRADYCILPYSGAFNVSYLMVDAESNIVRGFTSANVQVFQSTTTQTTLSFNQASTETGFPQTDYLNGATQLGTEIGLTSYSTPTPVYMDISQGVSLSSSVNWDNGYQNGGIDILFRAPSGSTTYSNTFNIPLLNIDGTSTGQTMTLTVNVPATGNVSVTLSSGSESDTASLGSWRNFMVSLDFVNGTYEAIPVTDFVSFTTYSVLEGSGQSLDVDVSQRCIDTMNLSAGRSLTFGIVQTSTFLNTYDAVMVDPSLNISDYFTELADIRLNFFSFALYGDSITINGETYEVDRNAQINVPDTSRDEPVDRWLTLTNIYITFEGANTYLTFVNDGLTIDLGPTTTTEISMDGIWYFTTGLYEGYETTVTVYEWDYRSFIFDSNTAIAVFLGLLALGTIVGSRMVRGGMSPLDFVVVGFAALCAFVLMVV